jgi:hypothetical protein
LQHPTMADHLSEAEAIRELAINIREPIRKRFQELAIT